jgi:hypothetical protein
MAANRLSGSQDIVTLRIARGGSALPVMRVLVGGMASRSDLPLDRLDDLLLAVEMLVAEESKVGSELVLELPAPRDSGEFRVLLGGLENQSVKAALLAGDTFRPSEDGLLDIRLILDSLVESYRVVETASASFAVEMEKRAS